MIIKEINNTKIIEDKNKKIIDKNKIIKMKMKIKIIL